MCQTEEACPTFEGSRIIDIDTLKEEMWCYKCNEPLTFRNVKSEIRKVLMSIVNILCTKCNNFKPVKTHKELVNDELALGKCITEAFFLSNLFMGFMIVTKNCY
uniref:Uncharacterized protein n=1 Tax=Trichogramma kaykai TaxID=54128 RepID=A0ABD2XQS0_9HYME